MTKVSGRRVGLVLGTSSGGTGNHVRALAAGLIEAAAHVCVLGPAATQDLFDFAATGARFVAVEIGVTPGVRDIAAARHLFAELHDLDLIHAHGLRAGMLTSVTAPRRRRVPFVTTLHNAVLTSRVRAAVYTPVERYVVRRSDVVLCVSSDLCQRSAQFGAADVRLSPVGARRLPPPQQSRTVMRKELLSGSERPLVLSVARLAHQKGIDVLLDAAVGWQARTPRPLLLIAGDGPDRVTLRDQAERLGVDVRFLGRRADVPELLDAADVVVLASRWEGSPLSAHEALQLGKPLVATDVGGVRDLVTGRSGAAALLVRPGNSTELGVAVEEILDNPGLASALGRSALQRADEWPDDEATVRNVLGVYEELLHAADGARPSTDQ